MKGFLAMDDFARVLGWNVAVMLVCFARFTSGLDVGSRLVVYSIWRCFRARLGVGSS